MHQVTSIHNFVPLLVVLSLALILLHITNNLIFSGPYYKYRVYTDMLQAVPEKNGLDCLQAMLNRIWVVPLYSVAFLVSSYFFPLSVSNQEGFAVKSCYYHYFYVYVG